MSRIFNSQGIVVIDYDEVEAKIEAYLVVARNAGCRSITVNVPTGQLLYLGNRIADAFAARTDSHCEVFYSSPAKDGRERPVARKSKFGAGID